MHYYPSSTLPSVCPICVVEIPEQSTVSDKALRQHLIQTHGRTLMKFMPTPDDPTAPRELQED